ncbi:MAG: ester cyclase [Pseudomonadota bacterium]
MSDPITHVATTDITDMLSPTPGRRMDLPGFSEEFVDFPHFIIRITERIWHDKEVERCHDWYAEDCPIHTLAGDITGAATVVQNTYATLDAFPDRRLDADNVIWSDEGDGAFYSSHLITSKMTNQGGSEFGPATGKTVRVQTIADCLCKENKVIREWLVRDNLGLVQQLGLDPDQVAKDQARADQQADFSLIEFHTGRNGAGMGAPEAVAAHGSASEIATLALQAIHLDRTDTAINGVYDFRADVHMPGSTSLYGPDQLIEWMQPLWSALPDVQLNIEHIAEIPYLGEARDVAIRWSLRGGHSGDGRYGAPTQAPILIMAVSQFRIMNGRVREEVTIWDDLAVRRQIETARLAP